ncbi:MAG: hypothetical protein IE933_03075 [Sphingomonadales bacterium]|nr:hypothetical protein [Sphingomonadales bacterium]MBD3774283.1 hypothetical protein [Paracoccaceae bacterium]
MISYEAIPSAIRTAVDRLPSDLLKRSGSVFYSGKEAFVEKAPLYVLGLNPGGIPADVPTVTIASKLAEFKRADAPWSEYTSSWECAPPGTWGLQPQILHMLGRLGLDPHRVPTSNVVFVQTRSENDLAQEKSDLLAACWPIHAAVIESLNIRTILCFGKTAGLWVRERLEASEQIDTFVEHNKRRWMSTTHRNADGLSVVTATHPSRVNWRNESADPTPLVGRALGLSLEPQV